MGLSYSKKKKDDIAKVIMLNKVEGIKRKGGWPRKKLIVGEWHWKGMTGMKFLKQAKTHPGL